MSGCIKDLYDCELVKKCSKCGIISLKSNFHKRSKSIDGLTTHCGFCVNDYNKNFYNKNRDSEIERRKKIEKQNCCKINIRLKEYIGKRRDSDLDFILACNLRNRLYKAYEARNVMKTNKTFDLLGCSHSFFQRWSESQLYGEMTLENYRKIWCLDHCLAIASFNLSDKKAMKNVSIGLILDQCIVVNLYQRVTKLITDYPQCRK